MSSAAEPWVPLVLRLEGAITLSGSGTDLVIGTEAAATASTVHNVVFEEAMTLDGNLVINQRRRHLQEGCGRRRRGRPQP